ncbi:MAG: M28 family peptidase [Promethearchaeota archaeon]|nr:MAG: M28 family peptidase [Candidatus Lokiarchaeota archaeon]
MQANESLTEYAYNMIKHLEETFGPRYSSSEAEKKANLWVKEEFSKFCDEVHQEEFETRPNAYPQGIIKITGVLAGIAFIFMPFVFPLPLFSAIFVLLGLFILITNLFLGQRWLGFLFKRGISSNVYGIIRPSGEVKYRILFEGHIDSAKQLRIGEYERLPAKRFLLGILYLVFTVVISLLKFFAQLEGTILIYLEAGPFQWTLYDWIYFLALIILYPCFIFIIWGLTGNVVVPGAADNLSGIAVTAALGKYVSQNRPKHIEIIVASMGSEEIGSRGADYFVQQHGELLQNGIAYVIDDSGAGDTFYLVEKSILYGISFDPEAMNRIETAHTHYKTEVPDAVPLKRGNVILGASDAAVYVKAGYKSGFILGILDREGARIAKPPHWHSIHDTWKNINKKMVRDNIGIALKFVELLDSEYS